MKPDSSIEPAPASAGPPGSGRPETAAARRTVPARAAKRILLVDDDPTVRGSLDAVLVSEGYCVTQAEDGQQALDLAHRSPMDLVLLDLDMPVKNSRDTFERLTSQHTLLPVIIVTARPNPLFMAVNAGAGALLEKPVDDPTLLRTIKGLLAEPARTKLARLAGQVAGFHHAPAKT